jgi:hypothetical protein
VTTGTVAMRATVGGIVGLLYGAVLMVLAGAQFFAESHNIIPDGLSSAPLSLFNLYLDRSQPPWVVTSRILGTIFWGTLLMWAAIGSLVALPGRGKSLRLAQFLIALHYVSGLAVLVATFRTMFPFSLRILAVEAPAFCIVYLAGQVALWHQIIKRC